MEDKLSRDDRRKQKELDEARKAGNAPAEVDEEGKHVQLIMGPPFSPRAGTSTRICRSTSPRRRGTLVHQGMHAAAS